MKKVWGIIALFVLAIICVYCWYWPYGQRSCAVPCMLAALRSYADDNKGWFPVGKGDALKSLALLYPKYIGPRADLLAGISGDRSVVDALVKSGGEISGNISSWVYFDGLRVDDDPSLALIYERHTGLHFNGSRGVAGNHVVGFVDGSFSEIPDKLWSDWLAKQNIKRKQTLSSRSKSAENVK